MKKSLLLSFCLLCVAGVSACKSTSTQAPNNSDAFYFDDTTEVIDTTTLPKERCGINGISCNDTALINYTKTEADYRAHTERTKRDHLYTQSGAGNNLTATIRPSIEADIVVADMTPVKPVTAPEPVVDEGAFSDTGSLELETQEVPSTLEEVGRADNIEPKKKTIIQTVTEEDGTIYEIVCQDIACTEVEKIKQTIENDGSKYEIICEENCEEIMSANADDDVITSEFTEESFDIADYIDQEGNELDIEFNEYGLKEQVIADASVDKVKVTDESVLTWEAEEGDNLRELLTKWSDMSGWKLLWKTNRNYTLSAGVMFKGKFADVSSALIRAFARARPAPIATYYKGNRVIVVETMENENAY
jgi:hypothetical protein